MRQAGYQPPPTARDRAMSVVHHADSSRSNLAHTGAHLDGALAAGSSDSEHFNLRHARGHAAQALAHVQALNDRLKRVPDFSTHYEALERSETTHAPARAEEAEQRALKRGMSPDRAERLERRLARQGGRR